MEKLSGVTFKKHGMEDQLYVVEASKRTLLSTSTCIIFLNCEDKFLN